MVQEVSPTRTRRSFTRRRPRTSEFEADTVQGAQLEAARAGRRIPTPGAGTVRGAQTRVRQVDQASVQNAREQARQQALNKAREQGLEDIGEEDIRVQEQQGGRVQARVKEDALRGALTSQVVEEADVGPGQVEIQETDEGLRARPNPELVQERARAEAAEEAGVPVESVEVERGAFAEPSRRNRPVLGEGDRTPTTTTPDDTQELRAFVDPEALQAQREAETTPTTTPTPGEQLLGTALRGATGVTPGLSAGTPDLPDRTPELTKTGVGNTIRELEIPVGAGAALAGEEPEQQSKTPVEVAEETAGGLRGVSGALRNFDPDTPAGLSRVSPVLGATVETGEKVTEAGVGAAGGVSAAAAGAVETVPASLRAAEVGVLATGVAGGGRAAAAQTEIAETGGAVAERAPEAIRSGIETAQQEPGFAAGAIGATVAGGFAGGAAASRALTRAAQAARRVDPRVPGFQRVEVTPGRGDADAEGVARFRTDPSEPAPVAAQEFRERARDVPDDLKDLTESDLVVGRSDPARIGGDLEVERGEFELPGLFGAPGRASELRITDAGTSRGIRESIENFSPGLPRASSGGSFSFFGASGVRTLSPGTRAGFAVVDEGGEVVGRFGPNQGGAARALEAATEGGQRIPDPEASAVRELDELGPEARGDFFVRAAGDRTREAEGVTPAGTRFERTSRINVRNPEGPDIPGETFRLSPGTQAARRVEAGEAVEDIADEFDVDADVLEGGDVDPETFDELIGARSFSRSELESRARRTDNDPFLPPPAATSPTSVSEASASSLAAAPSASAVTNATSAAEAGVRASETTLQEGVSEAGATTTPARATEPTSTAEAVSETTASEISESISETSGVSEATASGASEVSGSRSESISEGITELTSISEGGGSSVSEGTGVSEATGGSSATRGSSGTVTFGGSTAGIPFITGAAPTGPPGKFNLPDFDEDEERFEQAAGFAEAQFLVDLASPGEALTGDFDIERGPVEALDQPDIQSAFAAPVRDSEKFIESGDASGEDFDAETTLFEGDLPGEPDADDVLFGEGGGL